MMKLSDLQPRTKKTLFWGGCAIVIFIYFAFHGESPESTKTQSSSKESRIFTDNDKAFAQRLIQAHRFDCTTVENMRDYLLGGGFVVKCRGSRGQEYWFNIEDRGGQWFVEYK